LAAFAVDIVGKGCEVKEENGEAKKKQEAYAHWEESGTMAPWHPHFSASRRACGKEGSTSLGVFLHENPDERL
jgi:hypothetical protein